MRDDDYSKFVLLCLCYDAAITEDDEDDGGGHFGTRQWSDSIQAVDRFKVSFPVVSFY